MIPAQLDLVIYKGSTQVKPIQWKSGEPLLPVNLSGCSIRMQVRPSADSNTVVDTLTTDNSRIIIDNPSTGEFSLHFPSGITSLVTENYCVYDLEVVYPSNGPVYTILAGKVTYKQDVTRL